MGTENSLKMGMSGVLNLKAGHSIPAEADLGRFISRDPVGWKGGLNLFGTHPLSPVTLVDPKGLNPAAIWVLLMGTGYAYYLNEAKKYAQQKARDLVNKCSNEGILGEPPKDKPKDGSFTCPVLNDKYKHCVVSCQTALAFDQLASWAIGFGHEMRAAISPNSTYDSKDVAANEAGIWFAQQPGASDAECEAKCAEAYGKTYTWPHYPG